MHTCRLSATFRSLCHKEGKEDQLDELYLEIHGYSRFLKVFFPFYCSSHETTSSQSKSQSHSSGVDHFTLLLLNTWLEVAGKLWLSDQDLDYAPGCKVLKKSRYQRNFVLPAP